MVARNRTGVMNMTLMTARATEGAKEVCTMLKRKRIPVKKMSMQSNKVRVIEMI